MKSLKKLTGAALGAVLLIGAAPALVTAQSASPNSNSNQTPSASTGLDDFLSAAQMQHLHELEAQLKSHEGDIEAQAQEVAANASALAASVEEKIAAAFPRYGPSISRPGWLGIGIEEVTPDKAKALNLSAPRGVLVERVEPDSPASKAGLRDNDVVTRYGDQVVEGVVQFRRFVRETPPGRTVALGIWRDGKSANVSIEVGTFHAPGEVPISFGNRPDLRHFDLNTAPLGIQGEDLSGQLGEYFGAPGNQGVLVREVTPGSAAEKAGIKAGDVIVKLGGQAIHSMADLRNELYAKRLQGAAASIDFGVIRKGAQMNLRIALG